jgi:hypothetical protein
MADNNSTPTAMASGLVISTILFEGVGGGGLVIMGCHEDNTPFIPKTNADAVANDPPVAPVHVETQIQGRGKALIATANIAVGQYVMKDEPIFMRDEDIVDKLEADECAALSLNAAVGLPAETRNAFFNLHQQGKAVLIEDLINTNGFKVRVSDGDNLRVYAGVFLGLAVS